MLLAQIGSFVPAESARVGVVDRVFTRVGASDRLARGESTFMVEMRETAEILAHASRHSLVILDEIGRGTSTFDGLSIAWAVAEYLHDTPGLSPRTLFATHYHELADLARTHARVGNAHFAVREWGEDVIFLRRLLPGAANRSYGIQVARLAGLPAAVIERAREILRNLEGGELDEQGRPRLAGGGERSRPPARAVRSRRAAARSARAGSAGGACARSTRSGPRRSRRWRCSRACARCSRRSRHDAAPAARAAGALALVGLLGVERPVGPRRRGRGAPLVVSGLHARGGRAHAAGAHGRARAAGRPRQRAPRAPLPRSRRGLGRAALRRTGCRWATACCRACASDRTRSARRASCSISSATTATG